MKRLLVIMGISLASVQLNAQFVNSEYYLIDSLDLKSLPAVEVQLIDSCLRHFHNDFDPVSQITHVGRIVELSWDSRVGPKYNKWIYNRATVLLEEITDEQQRLKLTKYLAGSLGYIGFMYQKAGNIESASQYYTKSSELFSEISAIEMKTDSTVLPEDTASNEAAGSIGSDDHEEGTVNLLLVVSLILVLLMLVLTFLRIRRLKKKSDTFDASVVR